MPKNTIGLRQYHQQWALNLHDMLNLRRHARCWSEIQEPVLAEVIAGSHHSEQGRATRVISNAVRGLEEAALDRDPHHEETQVPSGKVRPGSLRNQPQELEVWATMAQGTKQLVVPVKEQSQNRPP
jgi:hypothetical protein